jgi:hypothetical protein
MNSTPFKSKRLLDVPFFHRLFRISYKPNALIELTNLLAASSPSAISLQSVAQIANKYKIDLHKTFRDDLLAYYELYLRYFLQNRLLSDQEITELTSLKRALGLTDPETSEVLNKVATEVYKKAVNEVLADGSITEEERAFLARLESQLTIPADASQRIYDEIRKQVFQSKVDAITSDQRISPEEQAELELLAKNLNISVTMDETTRSLLDKYRLFWFIENVKPPELRVDINLQMGEVCHFNTPCSWSEFRKARVSYGYSGPTMRVKIAQGIYWRAGNLAVRPVSQDELTLIETGTLYLTNKRLVFIGARKSTSIRLPKILDFEAYSDGVFIKKDSGKSPFLGFAENIDVFCVILGRVLRDI